MIWLKATKTSLETTTTVQMHTLRCTKMSSIKDLFSKNFESFYFIFRGLSVKDLQYHIYETCAEKFSYKLETRDAFPGAKIRKEWSRKILFLNQITF